MVDRKIIMQSAVNIAKEISASAIIIMSSDLPQDIGTDIPVLIASPSATLAAAPILETSNQMEGKDPAERLQVLSKVLLNKASTGSEYLLDASAIAFINNLVTGDKVVGVVSHGGAFTIVVHDLKDNKIVKELRACADRINLSILKSVLIIAMDLGIHGREGKSIGTGFIIGDAEEVMKRSHQLVLNPFFGHAKEECNILEKSGWENVKEFSQLDGIFILDDEGNILAAGRYLDVNARDVVALKGLGGRHASAAAITRDTEAIAITVSESGGVVRVYKDGIQIIELDAGISKVYRAKEQ